MKRLSFISLLCLVSTTVYANNQQVEEESHEQEKPVFYCSTNNEKLIELSKYGEVYIYRFGADLNSPELTLENHIEEVIKRTQTENGIEVKRSYDLKSGPYTYSVFSSNPKIPEENGVEVFKHKKRIARVECSGGIHIFE